MAFPSIGFPFSNASTTQNKAPPQCSVWVVAVVERLHRAQAPSRHGRCSSYLETNQLKVAADMPLTKAFLQELSEFRADISAAGNGGRRVLSSSAVGQLRTLVTHCCHARFQG